VVHPLLCRIASGPREDLFASGGYATSRVEGQRGFGYAIKLQLRGEVVGTDKCNLQASPMEAQAGFLYQLAVAFPSWAGAILALYTIFLSRFGLLKFGLFPFGGTRQR